MKNLMLLALMATAFSTSMSACEDLVSDLLGEKPLAKTPQLPVLDSSASAVFPSSELSCGDLVSELLGEEPLSKAHKPIESGAVIGINVHIDASILGEDWLRRFRSQKDGLEKLIRVTVNIDGLNICLPKECNVIKISAVDLISNPTKEKEAEAVVGKKDSATLELF